MLAITHFVQNLISSASLERRAQSWWPYLELVRLNQPHGLLVGLFSHALGVLYASAVAKSTAQKLLLSASIIVRLFLWLLLCRSAGCAWNDVVDQDYDRKTARCSNRPIARGALRTSDGCWIASCLVALSILPLLSLRKECIRLALLAIALTTFYPFAKRVTNFPQVVLGLIAGITATLAAYAVDVDALSASLCKPTYCLTGTVMLHLIFYDLVYSRKDVVDDVNSGVKSMTVLFRNYIPVLLGSLALSATLLVLSLGTMVDLGMCYFVLAAGGQLLGLGSIVVFTILKLEAQLERHGGLCFFIALGSLLSAFAIQV